MTGTSGNTASPPAPYDWEIACRDDPRTHALQAALDRILVTSFPSVLARLQKAEPPTKRQESALPSPPIDAPVVKPEPTQPVREELDFAAYLTESSSDVDSQAEIDPKEVLREMEARAANNTATAQPTTTTHDHDVTMADSADDNENVDDDEPPTACAACHRSDNEKQVLLCDGCDDEYHMYCLRPPLTAVPQGDWFCPKCAVSRSSNSRSSTTSGITTEPEAMDVDYEPLSETIVRIKNEKTRGLTNREPTELEQSPSAATSVSIAQTFENDVEKSNELLVHACNCDALRCTDAAFRAFCPHMKRFLRSACWASHNEKWLSYRIAKATAELLAFHSLHCHIESCNVPLCEELRAEEQQVRHSKFVELSMLHASNLGVELSPGRFVQVCKFRSTFTESGISAGPTRTRVATVVDQISDDETR